MKYSPSVKKNILGIGVQQIALLSVSMIVSGFSTGIEPTEGINVRRGLDDMIWVGQE